MGKFRKLSNLGNALKWKSGDKSNRNTLDPSAIDMKGSRTSLSDCYTTDDSGDQRSLPNSSPSLTMTPEKKGDAAAKGVFKRWLRTSTTDKGDLSSPEILAEPEMEPEYISQKSRKKKLKSPTEYISPKSRKKKLKSPTEYISPKSRKKKMRSPISCIRKRKVSATSHKRMSNKLTTLEYIQCNIKFPNSYNHEDLNIESERILSAITDTNLSDNKENKMDVDECSPALLGNTLLRLSRCKPPRIKIEDEYRNILNSSFETDSISAMSPASQLSR